jgi:hypothetical protein
MYQEFQEVFNFTITIREVIANVLVATFCGTLVSFLYSFTQRGVSYSLNVVKSIIMLSMITSFVMMVIGDNLARAFGMVGLISLIQFRTTIKGAQDFMYIYFALAIGLAAGVGLYAVTLVGTLLIGLITWIITELNSSTNRKNEFTLLITNDANGNQEKYYEIVLSKFCRKFKLVGAKAVVIDSKITTKLSYYVMLRTMEDNRNLLTELHQTEGTKEITIQFEED